MWVAQRHSLCEKGSCRMTDESRFVDPDRIHERIDIGGVVVCRVAALRLIRVPVPALVGGEGVVLEREQGEHLAERIPRIGVPVEKDDRFLPSVAPFGVVELHTRREMYCSVLYFCRLVHRFPPARAPPP